MVGIVSYGAYIPRYRIKTEEIAKVQGKDPKFVANELLIVEKSVPSLDEDSLTMGFDASINSIMRSNIDKRLLGAIYAGSESPVYAVKPNASIIGEALGIGESYTSADIQFACKAGTAAMQMIFGLAKSGFIQYGLAIGSDTAQSAPGDLIEHTSSAGAAGVIIGNNDQDIIAELKEMHSLSSDTPDFWRNPDEKFPVHSERFTGIPAYFRYLVQCTKELMEKAKISSKDIDHVVFHTPNGKFPLKAGKMLGFNNEQLRHNLLVSHIGNTYSAASMLILTDVLDNAKPGEKILMTSFGSGAGSDSFLFEVTKNITKLRKVTSTQDYLKNKEYISYGTYCKNTYLN